MDINDTIRQMVREEVQSALSKVQLKFEAAAPKAAPVKAPSVAKAKAPRKAKSGGGGHPVKEKILDFLKTLPAGESATAGDIGKGIGGNPNTVNVAVNRLYKTGDIARLDRGRYALPMQNGAAEHSPAAS